ncbi:hypothetical protein KUCAC02_024421, partial [Chaenocephalus aceratus]
LSVQHKGMDGHLRLFPLSSVGERVELALTALLTSGEVVSLRREATEMVGDTCLRERYNRRTPLVQGRGGTDCRRDQGIE